MRETEIIQAVLDLLDKLSEPAKDYIRAMMDAKPKKVKGDKNPSKGGPQAEITHIG